MTFKSREQRGLELVRAGAVRKVTQSLFLVRSQRGKDEYEVRWERNHWSCSCEDFRKSHKRCKHIYALNFFLQMQMIIQGEAGLTEVKVLCPHCNSPNFIKRGYHYGRKGPVQRYLCKKCGKRFSNVDLERAKNEALIIATALDLYFKGLSLRDTAAHLESQWRVKVSYTTVLRWIGKFVEIVSRSMESKGKVRSKRWGADETILRLEGRKMLMWTLLDQDHRFLIALEISKRRTEKDASRLIKKGLERAQRPEEIVTDGAQVYPPAISNAFGRGGKKLIHVSGPGLVQGQTNNRVERFHRSVKQRTKPMGAFRSAKSLDTFAKGFRLQHNFIKPHHALDGKTPAESAGLADGRKTWRGLIREAKPGGKGGRRRSGRDG